MKVSTILKSKKLHHIYVFLFWIGVWEIISLIIDQELLLPSPLATTKALIDLLNKGFFWASILSSMLRVILGFSISLILGLILGLLSGLNKPLHTLLKPFVIAIKSTPVMSVIVIALIWFRSSNVPIFVAFLMCFPIVWTNVVEGIGQVDAKLLEMARIYNIHWKSAFRNIYMPSIKPYILAAVKNTLGLSWKVTVAAEVLSSPKYSVGYHLLSSKVYLETNQLFAWTAVIILLSFFFEYSLQFFIKGNFKTHRS